MKLYLYYPVVFLLFFMRTNLCNALVIQENSYAIANINFETMDTVQKIIQGQTTATQQLLIPNVPEN